MARRKRRRFTTAFRKRVVLEALRGDLTLREIATRHDVLPTQVSAWKRRALDGLDDVFGQRAASREKEQQAQIRELHVKIGELTMERDFFRRGFER